MDRRPALWITGVSGVLAIALVAAPVWDAWRYRRLRSPVGPHVPVGVILPLRDLPTGPPSGPPATAPATTATPDARIAFATAGAAAAPAPAFVPARTISAAATPTPAPERQRQAATPEQVTGPSADRRAAGHAGSQDPNRLPAASRDATAAEDRAARRDAGEETQAGASHSENDALAPAASDAIGWVAVPLADAPPQPIPEPQDAPPPPENPAPTPGPGDPNPMPTPQAIPTLQLVTVTAPVPVGSSFLVAVRLNGASNVTSLPFHVGFDPAVLEFQSVEEGPAVGGAMQPILLASVSPSRPGDLAVGLSLVEAGGLLQGTGTVMKLRFRALAPGTSPLDFSRATIRGRTSEPLDARFQNTAVEVR